MTPTSSQNLGLACASRLLASCSVGSVATNCSSLAFHFSKRAAFEIWDSSQ